MRMAGFQKRTKALRLFVGWMFERAVILRATTFRTADSDRWREKSVRKPGLAMFVVKENILRRLCFKADDQ